MIGWKPLKSNVFIDGSGDFVYLYVGKVWVVGQLDRYVDRALRIWEKFRFFVLGGRMCEETASGVDACGEELTLKQVGFVGVRAAANDVQPEYAIARRNRAYAFDFRFECGV